MIGLFLDLQVELSSILPHKQQQPARYSASAEDLDTVFCFLDLQDTNELPKKTQYPVVDLRVSGQSAQSESKKALICRSEVEAYKSPWQRALLMYCSMC